MFVPAIQIATGLFTGGISNAGAYYGLDYGFQGLGALVDKTLMTSDAKSQKEADQLGYSTQGRPDSIRKALSRSWARLPKRRTIPKRKPYFAEPPMGERLVDAFTETQYLPHRDNDIVDSAEFRLAKQRVRERR